MDDPRDLWVPNRDLDVAVPDVPRGTSREVTSPQQVAALRRAAEKRERRRQRNLERQAGAGRLGPLPSLLVLDEMADVPPEIWAAVERLAEPQGLGGSAG